jgi:serine/threonine protein kinase
MADSSRSRALQAAAASGPPAALRELVEGQAIGPRGELVFKGHLRDGGVSWVMRVLHRETGSHRAMKVIRPELLADAQVARELERELERSAAVPGDFAVRLFDVGRLPLAAAPGAEPLWYLTTEWLDGRSVREEIARAGGTLSPERAFSVALQAARAVGELHRCGIVHGDIRPEHLVVGRSNAVRLIDYGVAPAVRERAETLWGVPWRSSRVVSPEVARVGAAAVAPAADVYQLGVLTYELFVGRPCSPFVAYDELAEIVELVPPELDDLVLECLGEPASRPADAGEFFARLREAEYAFAEAQRKGRPRAERKAKAVWAEVCACAGRTAPPWGRIATVCERLLEEKPGMLPFGKLPVQLVEDLLRQARGHLQAARRRHLDELVQAGAWLAAEGFVDQLSDEVAATELAELRYELEMARLAAAGDDPAGRAEAGRRLTELLREPGLVAVRRAGVSRKLEELRAVPPPPPPKPAIRALTELGELPPTERWRLTDGESTESFRVVIGPAVRLGRGSFEEFGNHLDLRPTRREAADDSTMLALAQTLSRAGHLELRVGSEGLEAFCLGTHGVSVDGVALNRGERAALRDSGECSLAQGAAVFSYRLLPGGDGAPTAVELRFSAGIGAGRRAYWVISTLPSELIAVDVGAAVDLAPTPGGWQVTAKGDGVCLGEAPLPPGSTSLWTPDVPLVVAGGRTIVRA